MIRSMSLAEVIDSVGVQQAVASLLVALLSLVVLMRFFAQPRWSPVGKHVFISGGSQGLGLALAKLLAAQGAIVTICARTQSKLDAALLQIQAASPSSAAHKHPPKHRAISADLSSFDGAKRAFEQASSGPGASVPDAVFCCAGGAKPGFFIEQTEKDFEKGMRTDYWTALSTTHAAASIMAHAPPTQHPRKIILVSSVLGFFGLVGYSQYTPMKHAVRGLAESLRSELLLYHIDVHAYFPSTILSPGFEEENKTKPAITREIEGVDEGLTPEACAKGLLKGVQKGQFFITTDFLAELFRSTSAGGATPGNGFTDSLKRILGLIGLPTWRILVADQSIKGHRTIHQKEMKLFS